VRESLCWKLTRGQGREKITKFRGTGSLPPRNSMCYRHIGRKMLLCCRTIATSEPRGDVAFLLQFFFSDSTSFWQQRQFQAEHEEKSPACSGREVHPICEDDNQTLTSRALGTGEERHSHRKRVGEILRPNCLGKILKRQNLITQTESF